MTYFRDLTPHKYTLGTEEEGVLSVGWLGAGRPFEKGETSKQFKNALKELCFGKVINMFWGFHRCELCLEIEPKAYRDVAKGNGEIRILGEKGVWYSAPQLIYHYVTQHRYKPPVEFIEAVLKPQEIADEDTR